MLGTSHLVQPTATQHNLHKDPLQDAQTALLITISFEITLRTRKPFVGSEFRVHLEALGACFGGVRLPCDQHRHTAPTASITQLLVNKAAKPKRLHTAPNDLSAAKLCKQL